MIANAINDYLLSKNKKLDKALLEEASSKMRYAVKRQLMEERIKSTIKHIRLSQSLYCLRQAAYKFHNYDGIPFEPRAIVKFLAGDIFEVAIVTLAKLAGCDIGLSQSEVEIKDDRFIAKGHIDSLLHYNSEYWIVEIKSVTQQSMDRFENDPIKWAKDWDYYGQGMRYAYAAEAKGVLFVAVCRDTGHIKEAKFNLDIESVESSKRAWAAIYNSSSPEELEKGFDTEDLFQKVQGKKNVPIDKIGIAKQSGSWYSWPTGKKKLCVKCSYCSFNHMCWPGAQMHVVSGKPVWIV